MIWPQYRYLYSFPDSSADSFQYRTRDTESDRAGGGSTLVTGTELLLDLLLVLFVLPTIQATRISQQTPAIVYKDFMQWGILTH